MARRFNVLLVEDDVAVQIATRASLEFSGHLVAVAATVDEGFILLSAAHTFDVILLDLRLGADRGQLIFERLQHHNIDYPPVVILSAQPVEEMDAAATCVKAKSVLRKPSLMRQVNEAMEAAVA